MKSALVVFAILSLTLLGFIARENKWSALGNAMGEQAKVLVPMIALAVVIAGCIEVLISPALIASWLGDGSGSCVATQADGESSVREGKLLVAGERFAQCARPECAEDVRNKCAERRDELERLLDRLERLRARGSFTLEAATRLSLPPSSACGMSTYAPAHSSSSQPQVRRH